METLLSLSVLWFPFSLFFSQGLCPTQAGFKLRTFLLQPPECWIASGHHRVWLVVFCCFFKVCFPLNIFMLTKGCRRLLTYFSTPCQSWKSESYYQYFTGVICIEFWVRLSILEIMNHLFLCSYVVISSWISHADDWLYLFPHSPFWCFTWVA